jgi:DNA processing protein
MNDQEPSGGLALLDGETRAALQLSLVPGIGPRLAQRLIAKFGTYEAIWRQPPERWRDVPGVGVEMVGALAAARDQRHGELEWLRCREVGVNVVGATSTNFPPLLLQIEDPPTVLYSRGDYLPIDSLAVAVVGPRHASPYGLRQAASLSASLSRAGLTLVSGLARGIDAMVHQSALNVGGRTIAMLAGGLLEVYPAEHHGLAEKITAAGAVMSEVGLRHKPRRGSFPRRNRLISGLSLGVIVIEATSRSGALITARHAMEQGRDVFAVPGPIDVRTSRGCHQLLRDGAKLVETADDVLEELGPFVTPLPTADDGTIRHAAELRLNQLEQHVLHAIDDSATSVDQLVARCGLPVQRILATLSVLETRRLISRVSGDRVQRRFAP